MGVDDPKVAAMLEYKGKAITVMNRPKSGRYQGLDSYWPYKLQSIMGDTQKRRGESSLPLSQVEVNFDNEKKRLRLEIDRY